jgi:hypothetical protein
MSEVESWKIEDREGRGGRQEIEDGESPFVRRSKLILYCRIQITFCTPSRLGSREAGDPFRNPH